MGERVLTVLGNKASRPIEDFMVNVSKEFYVGPNGKTSDVGDDDRSGRSKKTSLATWAKAVTKATASRGDIIYLLPGHTETFATAAAVNLSKIGVRTINLGQGALAATFTFSAVGATITMTAASCSIEGFPIFKPSIDSVVSPLVISAADCKADIQIQDASALMECVNGVLTTAAADRLDLDVKYRGFIAGDACVNAVRLVGVDTARINVDFYGVASTSIVEFHTTACHDIDISGKFYNDGTSLTKNVVDSVGGTPSTWSCQGWDGNSNANFSGGDNAALATDDVTALATAIGLIDEFHDVPAANNTLNAQVNEVIGNKTDTTATGAVTATDTLVAYIKQLVAEGIARDTALGVVDGLHDVPTADAATNLYMRDVVGIKTDAAAVGAISNVESLMAYVKQAVTLAIARDTAIGVIDGLHDVPTADAATNAFMRDVVGIKTDAAINAVTTTKTLMAYLKGVLNEITVPTADNTDNAFINDVLGQKTDAAATGAVTTTDTLVGYIKQLVGDCISILADTGTDGVVLGADSITAAKIGDDAISEEHFDGDAVQAVTMGKKVSKATAVIANNSTVDLFTVGTGRVVVHAIVGEVTTLVQSQATSCKLISTPTTGTAADLCGALDLTGDEAGCLYGITGLTGDVMIGTNAGATICPKHGVIVPIGVIGFNNASGANTGSVKWDIYYTPLDTGATIVSA